MGEYITKEGNCDFREVGVSDVDEVAFDGEIEGSLGCSQLGQHLRPAVLIVHLHFASIHLLELLQDFIEPKISMLSLNQPIKG